MGCIFKLQLIWLFLYGVVNIKGTMKGELYLLLGDVVASRKLDHREDFQKKLNQICFEVNQRYKNDLYANMKIIKGADEIGCVFKSVKNTYEMLDFIWNEIQPQKMRFVLVRGLIDTAVSTKDVTQMDGPAFHRASNMMVSLKKSGLLFEMSVGDDLTDTALVGQVNLITMIKNSWSSRRREIVRIYDEEGNQEIVADKMGISQQAVSKNLKESMWNKIKPLEENLKVAMNLYSDRLE